MRETTLSVLEMGCSGCEAAVVDALDELDGIEAADANADDDAVRVVYDPDTVATSTVTGRIEDAGYPVEQ